MTSRVLFAALLMAFAAACAHQAPAPPAPLAAGVELIDAAPDKGFNYPYVLRFPEGATGRVLLVEPNNTGQISDDLATHVDAAMNLSKSGVGAFVAKELRVPLLMPVFPRPKTGWEIYTHLLDRDAMLIDSGPMKRLDLQLIAMIDDAQARLRQRGHSVPKKVIMTGFSASGSFVNRFTMMHPERVQAVSTGGLNGMIILPLASRNSLPLDYPLGINDLATITGSKPNLRAWKRVPQMIYMGALDDNDAVLFDDGYSEAERQTVFRAIGEKMQPDRWVTGQQIYRDFGANVTFRTYEGIGHATNRKIGSEVAEFLRLHLD